MPPSRQSFTSDSNGVCAEIHLARRFLRPAIRENFFTPDQTTPRPFLPATGMDPNHERKALILHNVSR
jgi:hypothetical protein